MSIKRYYESFRRERIMSKAMRFLQDYPEAAAQTVRHSRSLRRTSSAGITSTLLLLGKQMQVTHRQNPPSWPAQPPTEFDVNLIRSVTYTDVWDAVYDFAANSITPNSAIQVERVDP